MTTTQQDNRKASQPSDHPHLPPSIGVEVFVAGVPTGTLEIPQRNKLSAKGNVSWSGGLKPKAGWKMDGVPSLTLNTLSIAVDGTVLTVASSGVHASKAGNPTVCHTGRIELPSAEGDETETYAVQAYVTYSDKEDSYSLNVTTFKAGTANGGPVVVGSASGFGIA